jgi:hypothetical protein
MEIAQIGWTVPEERIDPRHATYVGVARQLVLAELREVIEAPEGHAIVILAPRPAEPGEKPVCRTHPNHAALTAT